jgi:hypothetical protein
MPINGAYVRGWYESVGPQRWVDQFHEMLGLTSPNSGRRICLNDDGKPMLESAKINPEQVSIKELAVNLLGRTDQEMEDALSMAHRAPVTVMEAATDVVPSQFANISAFNAAAIGLLEARILQAYSKPTFLIKDTFENIPSKIRRLKMVGVSNIGDVSQVRDPGQRHARAQLSERYTETPQTRNRGVSIEVTREAILFDYSRELMKQADSVGDSLALRKEYLCLDVLLGIYNPYNYNGTSYNTYATAAADTAGGNWINSIANPIDSSNAWDAFNNVLQLWVNMVDPETGQPISIEAMQMLTMPAGYMQAEATLQASEISRMANALSNTYWPADAYKSKNPARGLFQLVNDAKYPYAYRRVTDSSSGTYDPAALVNPGLGLSGSGAKGLWFVGDFKKAFHWHENIPLTTVRANASDWEMGDRGLVVAIFADEMGAAGVTDPRYAVKNTYT